MYMMRGKAAFAVVTISAMGLFSAYPAAAVTIQDLQGVWVGARGSAAYSRYDNKTSRYDTTGVYTGGCLAADEEMQAAFADSGINVTNDAVMSAAYVEIDGDDLQSTYLVPVTNLDNAVGISGVDQRMGFNGTITSFNNGLANVSIPAQQGMPASTACVRIDVSVNKAANAVIMKTTQEIRTLFVNGTAQPMPSQCPRASAARPVCIDSQTARPPAAAPAVVAATTPATAPAPRPPTKTPSANATSTNATTDYFSQCVRPSLTLNVDDVPTCLAYLIYALQAPYTQLAQPTTLLEQCYDAVVAGADFSSDDAAACVQELRSLYNATINSSSTSAQSFCTASTFDNCAACTWCRTNIKATEACNSDCRAVSDFPDITMDGSVYSIYPSTSTSSENDDEDSNDNDDDDSSTDTQTTSEDDDSSTDTQAISDDDLQSLLDTLAYGSTTPSVPSTDYTDPSATYNTLVDQYITNAPNYISAPVGIGPTGISNILASMHQTNMAVINNIGRKLMTDTRPGASRTTTSLPAGSYVITSVVTSELKCTEGACLDLLTK